MDKFANLRGAASDLSRMRRVNVYLVWLELIVAATIALVLESGLPSWQQWGLVIAIFVPSALLVGLIDHNIPQGATYIWPKVWCIRGKRMWPRQK